MNHVPPILSFPQNGQLFELIVSFDEWGYTFHPHCELGMVDRGGNIRELLGVGGEVPGTGWKILFLRATVSQSEDGLRQTITVRFRWTSVDRLGMGVKPTVQIAIRVYLRSTGESAYTPVHLLSPLLRVYSRRPMPESVHEGEVIRPLTETDESLVSEAVRGLPPWDVCAQLVAALRVAAPRTAPPAGPAGVKRPRVRSVQPREKRQRPPPAKRNPGCDSSPVDGGDSRESDWLEDVFQ